MVLAPQGQEAEGVQGVRPCPWHLCLHSLWATAGNAMEEARPCPEGQSPPSVGHISPLAVNR